MTRTGPTKSADDDFALGRLKAAKEFRRSASDSLDLAEHQQGGSPIISNIVLSAIAYGDALTAKFSGKKNQKDHGALLKVLRDALGNELPQAQSTALTRLLGMKDQVQYGARLKSLDEARAAFELLEKFGNWAENKMAE